jgi:leader peptidase (prepilin peptidase)/N-methyltransferase
MTTEQIIETALVLALGLVVGSFLNVVIYRLPRRESVVSPGSRCTACAQPIGWRDNVPVLSYLLLRARCRACGARISVRYPVVEIVTAAAFVATYFAFGWTPLLGVRLLFAAAMIALFCIDLEHQILPDRITLPGIVLGLVFSLFLPPGLASAAIGLLIGGGFLWLVGEAYYRYAGEEGMGGGDVKMLAMIGAFLGWPLTILTLVLSSLVGSAIGLGIIILRRGGLKSALPFGTFLALSGLIASIWGTRILDWYLRRS